MERRMRPFQRGKLDLAGAIDDLLAAIELERQARAPGKVTYETWEAEQREVGKPVA